MPKYDDRTLRGWPLPHRQNKLSDDADRLRETLTTIDTNITEIETSLQSVEDVSEFLSTRMEVVVGAATEDAEILDARVDAEGKVHPNLGHNVRSIHGGLLQVISDIKYGIQEFQGLLHQFSAVAEAQIQDELNARDANERRKAELRQEALTRLLQDDGLQSQINAASEAIMRTAVTLRELSERRKAELAREESERISMDDHMQRELNTLAESFIRDLLNLHEAIERRKADLTHEERERIEHDADLQAQIDKAAVASLENALGIHQEAEQRRKSDERIEALRDESGRQRETDAYHQQQIDDAIRAILYNALTLSEALARGRAALTREEQARVDEDAGLQRQVDTVSQASMRNALNLQQEAEQRRQVLAQLIAEKQDTERQIQGVRDEMGQLYEIPLPGLYEQLAGLQAQANQNAEAEMRNTLNLMREAEHRREESSQRTEADAYQQTQIDGAVRAILEDAVNLHDEVVRRKAAESQERQSRFEEDVNLQAQQDTNSAAILELALNLSEEAAKRRKLEGAVKEAHSPVDWSKSSSLAILEPHCAVVNFTGLKAMPTSKVAEIPAVMEFWDMQGNYFKKPIVCSAQGSSSLGYVKKNVKFDLLNYDGSEFDLKIGGWVVQDGFHLKAYYTDFFRGVGVTSYKFWDEIMRYNGLDKDRPYKRVMIASSEIQPSGTSLNNPDDLTLQFDTGALCHPDGFPCLVYLNGTFYGVYSWQIKKQRKNYHMDKSTVEHIHLDGTLSTANFWNGTINWAAFEIRNPNKLYTMDGKKYDGDAPRELIDETSEKYDPSDKNHVRSAKVKRYIQSLVQRFGELKQTYATYRVTDPERVKAAYEELFDWENMRDYLIFSDVIKNSDGFAKNWQWTTYDGVKWYVNAYDLDMSYGGHWQGIQITAPLTGHITTSTALPVYYVALLYKAELEARYRELRDAGIISVNNILSKLADWTARIGVSNYELEYERWPNSPCILNYTDSIYRVKRWLEVEIANMDKVYSYGLDDEAPQPEAASLEEIEAETRLRASEDAGIVRQVNALAYAEMESELNHARLNAERRHEESQEREIRDAQDAGLQAQIDKLAEANMWILLKEHETRQKLSELQQSIEETPGRYATDEEVSEVLDEVFNP